MLELIAKTESVEPAHQESKLASVPDRVTVSQFQIFSETRDTSRRLNITLPIAFRFAFERRNVSSTAAESARWRTQFPLAN